MKDDSKSLEEELFDLMNKYRQPVEERRGYTGKVVAGVAGLTLSAAVLGLWLGSQFMGPRPSPISVPTYTSTPPLEARVTETSTLEPSPTVYFTHTPSPEPTHTPTETSTPTSIATPTYTATPTQTFTPIPTNTPIPPTPTNTPIPATPTNTPIPNTPPGSVLSLGQMWRQEYAGLTLTHVYYEFLWAKNFFVGFTYKNFSDQSVILGIYPEQFSAIDNLENIWPSKDVYSQFAEVKPGKSFSSYVIFDADQHYVARPDVNYLMVTINGLSSIQNAKWRIDIQH